MKFALFQISGAASRRPWALRTPKMILAVIAALSFGGCATGPMPDALPSWNDGPNKQAIVNFVANVAREGSASYVPPAERIATFDNDGTLWNEYPQYVQLAFMLDQVKAAAPKHPEWAGNPVFKALVTKDEKALAALGEQPLMALLVQANSGMTVDEYDKTIRQWIATARHPTLKRLYTDLVFQPQIELLSYLRANGFKTFIVSGGTLEFMRPWSAAVYGVPPENVVGSSQAVRLETRDGKVNLVREPTFEFNDDGPGKPMGIYMHIGQRPILAFGNSDGDQQMLEYTADGIGQRLVLLVHHDDAEREFAYDRVSRVGKLDKALDEATEKKWLLVSMKRDWKTIFPEAGKQ